MKKKLPAIYRSDGPKKSVNKEAYYSFLEEDTEPIQKTELESEKTIDATLDRIFKRKGYPFNPIFDSLIKK